MTTDDDLRVRPGRIRSRIDRRAGRFVAQALAAVERAGGRPGTGRRGSHFGRGGVAAVRAERGLGPRMRQAVVKARVARQHAGRGALKAHLAYLRRDGVTRDQGRGVLFGAESDEVDPGRFAERCDDDRHHFRFIVSPEDARDMADFKRFTRELMEQAERDLGTRLDWVAVDHWNTDNPHVHIVVRGRADDGRDLVIGRDYISTGMRARAQSLVTDELGPRTEHDIAHGLAAQVDAERWTRLDRHLQREAAHEGVVDAEPVGRQRAALQAHKARRLRALERLGLAEPLGAGLWRVAPDLEPRLRALGARGDIIKRIHDSLAGSGLGRPQERWALEPPADATPIVGSLVARGLDDELRGSAWAVVDGVDGRVHHLRFSDLAATGDAAPGSIVELRRFVDRLGRDRSMLAVRSDLELGAQVVAEGATWLDRQLVAPNPASLGEGFGAEVRDALERRAEHLGGLGLAERRGGRNVLARGLLDTLRARELGQVATKLAAETGSAFRAVGEGEQVAGSYRRRLSLASGRFAMIDDGLGFSLVPWTPSLDRQLGRAVSGIARADGGIDWNFGRVPGLGL